jgi:hypothetical protein
LKRSISTIKASAVAIAAGDDIQVLFQPQAVRHARQRIDAGGGPELFGEAAQLGSLTRSELVQAADLHSLQEHAPPLSLEDKVTGDADKDRVDRDRDEIVDLVGRHRVRERG